MISRVSSSAAIESKALLDGMHVGVGGGMISRGLIVVVLVIGGPLSSISCLMFLLSPMESHLDVFSTVKRLGRGGDFF